VKEWYKTVLDSKRKITKMSDNTQQEQQQQQQTPLQTLVSQIRMLDEQVSAMMQQENGIQNVIENYICPILTALATALDQSFAGLNNVAQTASVALLTSEKTLAGDTLSQVADISAELEEKLEALTLSLNDEQSALLESIKELNYESIDLTLMWLRDAEDDQDIFDDESEEDAGTGEGDETVDSEADIKTNVEVLEGGDSDQ
jgi:uncharacterized coiled-coil DUF342 family protein